MRRYVALTSLLTPEALGSVEAARLFCACAQAPLPFTHPDRERRHGPPAALLESPQKIRPGIPILVSCASVAGLMWRVCDCAGVERAQAVVCVCSKRVIVKHAGDEEANMAALPLQREHTVFNSASVSCWDSPLIRSL